MPRATADSVRAISSSTLTDPQISHFIVAANCQINKVVSSGCVADITEDCLASAEAFLTCHIMSGSKGGEKGIGIKTEEKFENWSVKYQRSMSGEGVLGTSYGIMANDLLNGCLVELGKRNALIFNFGGA